MTANDSTAENRLARIIFDGLYEAMPEVAKYEYRNVRAPWLRDEFLLAARAALPELLKSTNAAEVLTREVPDPC